MTQYKECDNCKNKICEKECFNNHPGSRIALEKVFSEMDVKVHIIDMEEHEKQLI